MNRLIALVSMLLLAAVLLGRHQPAQDAARFGWVDVYVDTGDGIELGAWQVDLVDTTGRATIVGIEGGEHPAFASPPHYDPRAMADSDRVILAAYSTADQLPTGRTSVARVHVRTTGDADWNLTLVAAANASGDALAPGIELEEGSAP